MVASYSSASPIPWRPTARTLGALFAGSAVTLSATVMHGGSLLTGVDETAAITEPVASPHVARPVQPPPASSATPGQATPWTPGATPQWSSALKDLPVRRAPVRAAPRHSAPARTDLAASAKPAASGSLTAVPTTPRHSADGASYSLGNPGKAAPQAADPQRSGLIGGVVSNVLHVTNGLGQ